MDLGKKSFGRAARMADPKIRSNLSRLDLKFLYVLHVHLRIFSLCRETYGDSKKGHRWMTMDGIYHSILSNIHHSSLFCFLNLYLPLFNTQTNSQASQQQDRDWEKDTIINWSALGRHHIKGLGETKKRRNHEVVVFEWLCPLGWMRCCYHGDGAVSCPLRDVMSRCREDPQKLELD